MKIKNLASLAIASCIIAFNSVYAYTLNEKFSTNHYAVYEVILGKDEVYGDELKNIIAKDASSKNKFQTTSVIFPYQSPGLNSTIKESVLGIITTENYDSKKSPKILFDDNAKNATYAGIYLTFKQLAKIADNKTLNTLIEELVQLPLLITDVPVSLVSKNYRDDLYYTAVDRAVLLDFAPIDSLFYTQNKLASLKDNKCKITILAMTDRTVLRVPYFISAHGALNDIKCN